MKNIRNFCIVAHIDHGKSTLADRLIEETGLLSKTDKASHKQVLDSMEIEQERGITIKSQTARLNYTLNGEEYILNLIDTPGHVDFSYEVSRALKACEGAVLIVDASQGVEAQTLTNFYLAFDSDLEIIPVMNKIDLPNADIEMTEESIDRDIGFSGDEILKVSAKMGTNIEQVLEEVVKRVPAPSGDEKKPLKALVFDAIYDNYKGVIVHIRVIDGTLKAGDEIVFMSKGHRFKVDEVGYMKLKYEKTKELKAGDVGYFIASIKNIEKARIGDTVTNYENPTDKALQGYEEVKPYVFSSIYPMDSSEFNNLSYAMEKLKLNDPALVYEKDNSIALGFGFRCGFLGMLHLEVVSERLMKEYGMEIILTAPSVPYKIKTFSDDDYKIIDNPTDYPDPTEIDDCLEPYVKAEIITPETFIGSCITLAEESRGIQKDMQYLDAKRVLLEYEIPLADIIYEFYDNLKSMTKGYASLDYQFLGYKKTKLAKMDIKVAGDQVDAFSQLVFEPYSAMRGRQIVKRLKKIIPRQQFSVALQATIGGKVVARETISAFKKDVLAKCYGGDITRKRKLLEKQKEGKKRMKRFGKVEIPQDAFVKVLKSTDDK